MPQMQDKKFMGWGRVKAVDNGQAAPDAPYGWVEGIANAFEVDRYGDLVLTEALMAAVPKFMTNPVLSFGHNIDGNPQDGSLPAGTILNITADAQGNTIFRARFANTPDAQLVRQMYRDGDMRAFSIHFIGYGDSLETRDPLPDELAAHPGCKQVITKLELIEIACAVVPVNAGSLATASKSFSSGRLKRLKPFSNGARKMGNSILTSDSRKAIDAAKNAFEDHQKNLEAVASHLEELAASKEGAEADHGSMCAKCHAAFGESAKSHMALGDAIKDMHVAITGQDPAGDDSGNDDGQPTEEAMPAAGPAAGTANPAGDGGSPPLPADPEQRAFVLKFRNQLAAR